MASHQKLGLLQAELGGRVLRTQKHFKFAALHAQALHGRRDGGCQPRGGLAAYFGYRPCLQLKGGGQRVFVLFQLRHVGGGVQRGQLVLPARQQRGQFGRAALVAAGQADPQRQAFVQLGQPLRLQFGVPGVAVQGMDRVLGLGQSTVQHLDQRRERRFNVRLVLQGRNRPPQQRPGAVVLLLQGVHRQLHRIAQRLGIGQAAVLRVEVVPFISARGQLADLANLPGQALAFTLQAVLSSAGVCQSFLGRSPLLPSGTQRFQRHAGVRVQEPTHRIGPGQALPRVLAVDVDQLDGNVLELGSGGGAAVDPGAAFALGVDRAAQQQGGGGLKPSLVQPGGQAGRAVKFSTDVAAFGAFAHHAGISPRAKGQLQRVNQNRFARAGFTRQHREAVGEVQVQRPDDDKVPQGNAFQTHATPSFQWSFLRSVSK